MAKIEFIGFIQGFNQQTGKGQDPFLERTQQGKPFLKLVVAEPHSKPNGKGGYDKTGTTFHRMTFWEAEAERWANIRPGTRVKIIGDQKTRAFTRDDGTSGYAVEVSPEFMRVIPTKNQQGNSPQGGQGFQPGAGQQPPAGNQGGYSQQNQGGYNHPSSDPWSDQNPGNYDWGAPADDNPPF